MPKTPNYGITEYKRGRFNLVNHYLRKGRPDSEKDREVIERVILDIDSEMRTGIPFTTLYRGTDLLDLGVRCKDMLSRQVNVIQNWKGYVSTSYDEKCAHGFAKGVLLIITPNAQTEFVNMMDYDKRFMKNQNNEKEILLKHGTRYKITKIDAEIAKKGKQYIQVHIILL